VLRLAPLGLKPEATAEGSQLKRAVGLFEVRLSSNVLVRLGQAVEWMRLFDPDESGLCGYKIHLRALRLRVLCAVGGDGVTGHR
jgi:hypothetical protein